MQPQPTYHRQTFLPAAQRFEDFLELNYTDATEVCWRYEIGPCERFEKLYRHFSPCGEASGGNVCLTQPGKWTNVAAKETNYSCSCGPGFHLARSGHEGNLTNYNSTCVLDTVLHEANAIFLTDSITNLGLGLELFGYSFVDLELRFSLHAPLVKNDLLQVLLPQHLRQLWFLELQTRFFFSSVQITEGEKNTASPPLPCQLTPRLLCLFSPSASGKSSPWNALAWNATTVVGTANTHAVGAHYVGESDFFDFPLDIKLKLLVVLPPLIDLTSGRALPGRLGPDFMPFVGFGAALWRNLPSGGTSRGPPAKVLFFFWHVPWRFAFRLERPILE